MKKSVSKQDYILPGFIDAHIHIESSMLIPSEFARLAVVHGTVASISDPHEIANVLGVEGVEYMIDNGNQVPFKFHFGAPSCVPATTFETAGAEIGSKEVRKLLQRDDIFYLSEMMNFPGVLHGDQEVMAKIQTAHELGKPVDGHAPGLRGEQAQKYIEAGISTDHECFTKEEALDKLKHGMKIIIREGSAAKNFEALVDLIDEYPDRIMFCSDDKHPNDLVVGHINQLVQRALAKGMDFWNVLQAACVNPVKHYDMQVGLLQEGDVADFIILDSLTDMKPKLTYINGECVAEYGKTNIHSVDATTPNQFSCQILKKSDLVIDQDSDTLKVIECFDGQLITKQKIIEHTTDSCYFKSNTENDILKLVVLNRYHDAKPAIAFIHGFGLKEGAIASTVAHDSHNIIAVGVNDIEITNAINLLIHKKGGVSLSHNDIQKVLALPVAGLMSHLDGYQIASEYEDLDRLSKEVLGSTLSSPYMTLSFMALLVIPELKLSDQGLFDGNTFQFYLQFYITLLV